MTARNYLHFDDSGRITLRRLRELLFYDPASGHFQWKVQNNGGRRIGKKAGNLNLDNGRWYINVDGRSYLANRLAWFYVHGQWPVLDIDHKDTDKTNDAFCNLREVSRSVNLQNQRRARKDNKLGVLGVYWHERDQRYLANIKVGDRRIFLGSFRDLEPAKEAYLSAKRKYHEGCTL